MPTLHPDEVPVDDGLVRRLLDEQFPRWSGLELTPAGHGTDNRMVRLGPDLVVRLPRTPGTAVDVAKESHWLPRLAPHLPLAVPEPLAIGAPGAGYPFEWAVYGWLDGTEVRPDSIVDPSGFASRLADFVRALHDVDLMGARREPPTSSYRGGDLADLARQTADNLTACRELPGLDLDLDGLRSIWESALAVEVPRRPHAWMHTDLKPSNLLTRDGVLVAVVDFGGLSVGDPTAEHATTWDLPADVRHAYFDHLELDRATRLRARGWALAVALSGIPYYWTTWPEFAAECVQRVRQVLADDR